ncbi:RNA polymerase sigma factor [Candidatus Omnitrophota bacterium]
MEYNCDVQIKTLIEKDDSQALSLIYDQYADGLYGYLLNFFGVRDDADEVLQRVFLKIVEQRQKLLNVSRIQNYLFIVTRNEAINYHREMKRQSRFLENWESVVTIQSEPDMLSHDDSGLIAEVLSQLPDAQREVIYLKIYEELTFDAIATILDISANTVASRYRYGMDKLRKRLIGSFTIER